MTSSRIDSRVSCGFRFVSEVEVTTHNIVSELGVRISSHSKLRPKILQFMYHI